MTDRAGPARRVQDEDRDDVGINLRGGLLGVGAVVAALLGLIALAAVVAAAVILL